MKKPLSSYFLAATKPERLTIVMGPMGNSLECGFAVHTGYVQRRTEESSTVTWLGRVIKRIWSAPGAGEERFGAGWIFPA